MEQEINSKVQRINEEDYEIIKKMEQVGYLQAVEWYKETYECGQDDAREAINKINDKYRVLQKTPEDEIIEMYNEYGKTSPLLLVKNYKEKYNVSLAEAKSAVDVVLEKNGLKSSSSGSGCVVTLLIAITSTLSLMFLI